MPYLQTTTTQYVKANNGVTFAYRRLGPQQGIPLVLHIHFRANMDFWDPLFINTLAAARPVIVFDQAGVGRSTGSVPTTFQGWANDLIAFIDAINLHSIDLLGFSMGGMAAQVAALTRPDLIRQLVLAGTTAAKPHTRVPGILWPREDPPSEPYRRLATAVSVDEGKDAIAFSFFPHTEVGHKDANEYWNRISERNIEPLKLQLLDRYGGGENQRIASIGKEQSNTENWFGRLGELRMPILVANGDNDLLIPTSRSWEMMTQLEKARLIIYPQAGHGFLWQYAEQFASDIIRFLEHSDQTMFQPKL